MLKNMKYQVLVSLMTFIGLLLACPSVKAEEGRDLSIWPKSVQDAMRNAEKKAEKDKKKHEVEEQLLEKRIKWITHEGAGILPYHSQKPFEPPIAIELDGDRYEPDYIIWRFLNTAFSNSLWFEDTSFKHNVIKLLKNRNEKIEVTPRFNAINKWNTPVKITLKTLENDYRVDADKYSYLINHLKNLTQIYSGATGLEISYVEEEYPKRSDANVFIVLNAKSKILNAFKNQRSRNFLDEEDYEEGYVSAVRFTPEVRSQVEGFFVPNKNNKIIKATCYLKPSIVPEEWSKALLAECVARVLGMPEASGNNAGLLSNWNRDLDDLSQLAVLDKRDRFDDERYAEWVTKVKSKLVQGAPTFVSPSEYDLKMLSTLYCPSIKPGMDKPEVVLTLLRNKECIEGTQAKGE